VSSRQYDPECVAASCKFVDELRARTFCAKCGKQPIEWHHKNPAPGDRWIAHLRIQGATIRRIEEELLKCEPLCRKCHMGDDGRLQRLTTNPIQPRKKGQTYVEAKPCVICKTVVKITRGDKCRSCYDGIRRGTMLPDGTKIDRRRSEPNPGYIDTQPEK